jgi:hypothetical protein
MRPKVKIRASKKIKGRTVHKTKKVRVTLSKGAEQKENATKAQKSFRDTLSTEGFPLATS